jgi:NAD(P)H-dependent FMN reductase
MPSIVVVTGSVRPNSVNDKIVPLVVKQLEDKGADVTIANLKELNMPFFDSPVPASNPDFAPTHKGVQQWTEMVDSADGVVFVTPEYNHTLSPVQLNAIDWIGKEWKNKPIALIGYGWTSGASQAHATAREALGVNLKANMIDTQTNLFLGKELGPDGSVAEETVVAEKISSTLDDLLKVTA